MLCDADISVEGSKQSVSSPGHPFGVDAQAIVQDLLVYLE